MLRDDGGGVGPVLTVCIVAKTDLRELLEAVGDALASAMLQPVQRTERLVFESLLASELHNLRRKGFNVDRFEDELAFARMQQQERAAFVLQGGARGLLVRNTLKAEATKALEGGVLLLQYRFRASHAARRHGPLPRHCAGLDATRPQWLYRARCAR